MPNFRPPKLPKDFPPNLGEAFRQLFDDLVGLLNRPGDVSVAGSTYRPVPGEVKRVSPPATGMGFVLPPPSADNRAQTITAILEKPQGALRVFVSPDGPAGPSGRPSIDGDETRSYSTAGAVSFISNGVDKWSATVTAGATGPGAFLRRTLYRTGTGATHTCLAGATKARMRGGGSGGAGGGCNAAAAQAAVGGGGSTGGVFDVIRDLTAGRAITYTVAASAAGVLGTTGNNGSATTATYNGETLTANGGLGSVSSTSGTTLQLIGCVDGGTATTSGIPAADDQYIKGGPGGIAVRETASSGCGGNGGSSAEAPGGTGASAGQGTNASADGNAGQFGSGGGGGVNFNNNPVNGNTGGAGGAGFLWIYEYGT